MPDASQVPPTGVKAGIRAEASRSRRGQILDAARGLFLERGVCATSVANIRGRKTVNRHARPQFPEQLANARGRAKPAIAGKQEPIGRRNVALSAFHRPQDLDGLWAQRHGERLAHLHSAPGYRPIGHRRKLVLVVAFAQFELDLAPGRIAHRRDEQRGQDEEAQRVRFDAAILF
jgi:hypothetical protein